MSDDRLSQADLDRIIADPLRATPVDAERMAIELASLGGAQLRDLNLRGKSITAQPVLLTAEQVHLVARPFGGDSHLARAMGLSSGATVNRWRHVGARGWGGYAVRATARKWRDQHLDQLVADINEICDARLDDDEAKSDN